MKKAIKPTKRAPRKASAHVPAQIVETGPCCGNCNFFFGTEPGQGVCRIKPPTAHMISFGQQMGQVMSFFPPIQTSGWCGCFNDQKPTIGGLS